MDKFHIIVEGREDWDFLCSYARHLRINDFSPEWLKNIEGKGNLSWPDIKRKLDSKITVIIIFDANSSYETTRSEIHNKLSGLEFKLFLFPNNQINGKLEDLLEEIVIPEHKDIFRCFEGYKSCLKGINAGYVLPDIKAKIYGYKEAIGAIDRENKEKQFDPEYWNFDSPELNPLKDFLLENLQ